MLSTSNPNRTSPVKRGAWILENIMGTPPAPPPPDVEALLKDNEVGAKNFKSVRERLEAHRSQPRCNACHGILDPLGFALDNFDAIGKWLAEISITPTSGIQWPSTELPPKANGDVV